MDNNTNNSVNNYYTNNNQYSNYNKINNDSYNQNNFNQENSFNQENNFNQNNNKKKKINKTLFLIIGIVLIAVLIFFVFKSKSSPTKIVSQNDTLKVYELEGIYNFEANILSLKDGYTINTYFDNCVGTVVEFKIKNISEQDLKLSLLSFYLLDDNGNKIDSAALMSQGQVDDKINKLDFSSYIPSGETVSGYVYFYDYDKEISLKDVSKIRIDVPKNVEKDGDKIHIDGAEYFIELN